MTSVPADWKTSSLGEIADTQLGKMLNKSKQTGKYTVPYLRSLNVQWGRIDIDDLNAMDIELNESDKFTVKKGDLLVCEGGESGRAAIWKGDEPIGFQNALHRIRPSAKIETRYLFYYFEWIVKNGLIDHLFNGVTIKHFPQGNLRSVKISYPPIAEQRQIVEILEDHLSRLDAALADVNHADSLLVRLNRSILENLIKPENDWTETSIRDISSTMRNGIFVSRPSSEPAGVPILRIGSVRAMRLELNDLRYTGLNERDAKITGNLLNEGDLLFTRYNGNLEFVAACAEVPTLPCPITYPDKLIRVELHKELAHPGFVAMACSGGLTRSYLRSKVKTTAGQAGISGTELKSAKIFLPPLHEQIRRAKHYQDFIGTQESTSSAVQNSIVNSESLRRSLLQAAFTGQLTREATHV